MKRHTLKRVLVAVLLGGVSPLWLGTPAIAARTGIQEKIDIKPTKSISKHQQSIISAAGARVLRHIAEARSKIHEKQGKLADEELAKADTLLKIIKESLPTAEVRDRIWVARKHLQYEDTQKVIPDLVPINTSLNELIDIMPVKEAKRHLSRAGEHLKSNDKDKARQALDEVDAALQYQEIDLPLGTTQQLVTEARASLGKNDLDNADRALQSAENSVVYLSFAIEQPLFAAKADLWQAIVDYEAGDVELAKTDLSDAITKLEQGKHSQDKATSEAATMLLKDARQLQSSIEGKTDQSAGLHRLWQRSKAFADRSLEYLVAGWQRYRTDSPLKDDLIEARLHLANARIDVFTGHEPPQARSELNTSMQYLDKAMQYSHKHLRDKQTLTGIDQLQASIKDLHKDPVKQQISRYIELEHKLNNMIDSL